MHPCASVANCQVQFMRLPLPSWNELDRATDAHGLETNLTEAAIGSAFEVSRSWEPDSEKVYERAMLRELTLRGVSAKTQASFPVC